MPTNALEGFAGEDLSTKTRSHHEVVDGVQSRLVGRLAGARVRRGAGTAELRLRLLRRVIQPVVRLGAAVLRGWCKHSLDAALSRQQSWRVHEAATIAADLAVMTISKSS